MKKRVNNQKEELKQSLFIDKMINLHKNLLESTNSGATKTVEQIYQIQDQLEKKSATFPYSKNSQKIQNIYNGNKNFNEKMPEIFINEFLK